jgi:hypothetical protein
MKLKYGDLEIEGKDAKEIDALLERAEKLMAQHPPKRKEQHDENFHGLKGTIEELAQKFDVSKACINQKLNAMMETGDAKPIGGWPRVWQVFKPLTFGKQKREPLTTKKHSFNVDVDDVPV